MSNINKLQGHAFSLFPVNVVLQCALVCVLKLSSCHISCIIKLTLESFYRGGLPNRLQTVSQQLLLAGRDIKLFAAASEVT